MQRAFIVSTNQKATCNAHEMQVKKEVPVEVVHFYAFARRRASNMGRYRRQLPGHLGSYWDDM